MDSIAEPIETSSPESIPALPATLIPESDQSALNRRLDTNAVIPAQTCKKLPHRFTTDNAAEFTKKGLKTRINNKKARLEKVNIALITTDPYVSKRLLRVRAQLERIDEMMSIEDDPQRLDRLASAQARLSVQEFALSGRPNPGSRRPGRESTTKRTGEVGPVE